MNAQEKINQYQDPQFIDRYEALRAGALKYFADEQEHSFGIGVFIHRGMFSWMKSWSLCTAYRVPAERQSKIADLDLSSQREMVMQLVNMALGHQKFGECYAGS